ncbi:hypothetical protein P0L94_00960 [Microbacter sp. GSS18]|nr:hypothetical protein P0L94_00960 [Microbacter sp. GSS18]
MTEEEAFDEAHAAGDVGVHFAARRSSDDEPYIPDDISLVVETASMESVYAAERYHRIDSSVFVPLRMLRGTATPSRRWSSGRCGSSCRPRCA